MDMGYFSRYPRNGVMRIVGSGRDYYLSDGSTWESGAGWAGYGGMIPNDITRDGSTIRYHMNTDDLLIHRIDYDSGDHSASYQLDTLEALTIVAEYGSTVGTITTEALITLDEPENYVDERFNFLSAPLCSVVPISITYTLMGVNVFDETLFDEPFDFNSYTRIDLTAYRQ